MSLEEMKQLRDQTFTKAKKLEALKQSAQSKLKLFPLWKRVLFFTRFSNLRTRIKNYELERSGLVLISLGMTRTIRDVERRLKSKGNV